MTTFFLPMILAAAAAAAPASTPAPAPEKILSVPAACADVYGDVFQNLDASITVVIRAPEPVLPNENQTEAFFMLVPGLERAAAAFDQLDRDLFFVHAGADRLAKLESRYPKLDPKLLRAAKVQSCRDAATR